MLLNWLVRLSKHYVPYMAYQDTSRVQWVITVRMLSVQML